MKCSWTNVGLRWEEFWKTQGGVWSTLGEGGWSTWERGVGVLWAAALLPRTSTGLEYSDSIGGCGVTVRVRKGDRLHFWGSV